MSNIYTSYVRIYRNDKKEIGPKEIEFISKSVIKWHDDFGSYHVPIVIDKRPDKHFLDIQYGSGKGGYHLYDFMDENSETYSIWHRINDSGEDFDFIERLHHYQKPISEYSKRPCQYAFDEIQVYNCPGLADNSNLFWNLHDGGYHKCYIHGFYYSDNGQFGKGEIINVLQKYDLPRVSGVLEWCSEAEVSNLLNYASNRVLSEVHFYFNKRKVLAYSWQKEEYYFDPGKSLNGKEFIAYAYDDWDNCADKLFIDFEKSYNEDLGNK